MATAAFKSTTKRSPIVSQSSEASDSSSSSQPRLHHRRSRSLSRFSGRFLPPDLDDYERPKARFGSKVRSSELSEINLEELANELFLVGHNEEKTLEVARGRSTKSPSADSSQRRSRSTSRSHRKGSFDSNSASRSVLDGSSRRRRSISVARDKCNDWESETDHFENIGKLGKSGSSSGLNFQMSALHKPAVSSQQHSLKRSMSQTDLLVPRDGYSRKHPAADDVRNGLYEAMRKEVRHAVEEIKMQLQQSSNDRTRMSKRLAEEAEKYFEGFISNVEDTDLSSFEGEKSDAGSNIVESSTTKEPVLIAKNETRGKQPSDRSLPVEFDGVDLPWLKWEATTDLSSLSCESRMGVPVKSRNASRETLTGGSASHGKGNNSPSSDGANWSLDGLDDANAGPSGKRDTISCKWSYQSMRYGGSLSVRSSLDMDEYSSFRIAEDLLFEKVRQRKRTQFGGLLLCHTTLF